MSNGKTHATASLVLAAGFSIASMATQNPNILMCSLGAVTGIFLSGDLDVDNGNISNTIIKKKVGWFGEKLWRMFWRGYSSSFKHGQFASHFPIFGTFTRLSYIYFWTILPFYVANVLFLKGRFDTVGDMIWWTRAFLNPFFFYGLCCADLIHFFLDILTKEKSN